MSNPKGKINLHQWLEALFDDASVFTNIDSAQNITLLAKTLENNAQYWENLLSVSGGFLELTKCFYYLFAWTFTSKYDPCHMSLVEIQQLTSAIQLQEYGISVPTNIAPKLPEAAHKTLGVMKTMIGNDRAHIPQSKHQYGIYSCYKWVTTVSSQGTGHNTT